MEFFKKVSSIDFMHWKWQAVILSTAINLIGIGSIVVQGFNFGLDFTGGTLIELGYKEPVELNSVRGALEGAGFGGATVQNFGSARDVLIRLQPKGDLDPAAVSDKVFQTLSQAAGGQVELRRVEFVGPQVGKDLTEQAGLAILYSLIGILIYVALRFEYRYAVGAIIATIHDVIVTIAVFSLFQIEFDLTVLAAVLAVIGYSLNDTIVIYDRIRENFRKVRKGTSEDIVNLSVNETMSRTIITSGTTFITVLALYLVGGAVINGFALALMVGIGVGTYSSIYVASAAALMLGISRADMMPVKKEGATLDGLP
jgi:preprotein translocase subunit SecF